MDIKYLVVGGITLFAIFVFGIGLYLYGNQGQQQDTLGAVASQTAVTNTNQNPTQEQKPDTLENEAKISSMKPQEFSSAIGSGEYMLIDIRTDQEYASGHIKGAVQSDFYQTQEFSSYLDSLDKNKKYLIYCRSGNRSGQALNIMQQKGFINVTDLAGGISAWTGAGLPIEK